MNNYEYYTWNLMCIRGDVSGRPSTRDNIHSWLKRNCNPETYIMVHGNVEVGAWVRNDEDAFRLILSVQNTFVVNSNHHNMIAEH